jgi:hypothetical protein
MPAVAVVLTLADRRTRFEILLLLIVFGVSEPLASWIPMKVGLKDVVVGVIDHALPPHWGALPPMKLFDIVKLLFDALICAMP